MSDLVIQAFLSLSSLFLYVSQFCASPYHFSKKSTISPTEKNLKVKNMKTKKKKNQKINKIKLSVACKPPKSEMQTKSKPFLPEVRWPA